jgi:hypothetical protein
MSEQNESQSRSYGASKGRGWSETTTTSKSVGAGPEQASSQEESRTVSHCESHGTSGSEPLTNTQGKRP